MAIFQARSWTVEAVQWRGDNVEEIQRLLAPASPLWGGEDQPGSLGVMCDAGHKPNYGLKHELRHANKADWVVKYPTGRVTLVDDLQFNELYMIPDAGEILPPLAGDLPHDALPAGVMDARLVGDGNGPPRDSRQSDR